MIVVFIIIVVRANADCNYGVLGTVLKALQGESFNPYTNPIRLRKTLLLSSFPR